MAVNVAVVGATGAVGEEFLRILEEREVSHKGIEIVGFKTFCREKNAIPRG